MLRLVQKLNSTLARFTAASSRPSSLPCKPNAGIQRWPVEEIQLLLDCERDQTRVDVQIGDSKRYQCAITGVDLTANELMIDRFIPALSLPQLADEHPFWLSLPSSAGEFRLCVQPTELLADRRMIVKIITTALIAHELRSGPVHFTRNAPYASLRLNSGKCLQAKVKRLSTGDALLSLTGQLDPKPLKPGVTINCTINFNEAFNINCTARILRRPFRQGANAETFVQLEFTGWEPEDQLQLRAYLQACDKLSEIAA